MINIRKRAVKIEIKFSAHAKEKMRSRGVKASDVLAVLKEPVSIMMLNTGRLSVSRRSTAIQLSPLTKWKMTELKL